MTLRAYVWGMRIITLLSLVALGAVIFYVDPESSGIFGIVIFYVTIFFALSGIFNLFLLFIRKKLLGKELVSVNVGLSFRQGLLLAIFCFIILILQSYHLLVWWNALLALAGIFLVEFYFLNKS